MSMQVSTTNLLGRTSPGGKRQVVRLQAGRAPERTFLARRASACALNASAGRELHSKLPVAACWACFAVQEVEG